MSECTVGAKHTVVCSFLGAKDDRYLIISSNNQVEHQAASYAGFSLHLPVTDTFQQLLISLLPLTTCKQQVSSSSY